MKNKEFKNISIRGRIAYSISCLENALQSYNLNNEGWNIVLTKLWEMTELPSESNESWLESASDYLPVCYVEDNPQSYQELFFERVKTKNGKTFLTDEPFVTKEEFIALKETYKNSNSVINSILENIFDLSTCEMMGGINDDSPHTLDALQDVLDIMRANYIPLPDISNYTHFEYDPKLQKRDYGWGTPFDGKKLSKILKK